MTRVWRAAVTVDASFLAHRLAETRHRQGVVTLLAGAYVGSSASSEVAAPFTGWFADENVLLAMVVVLVASALVGSAAESVHAGLLAEGRTVVRIVVERPVARVALANVRAAAVTVHAVLLADWYAIVDVFIGWLVTWTAAA